MKRLYKDGGEMILEKKKKHPTREILEKGGIVDGEDFELMLIEEAEVNRMEILESIEENLIQLNKTTYEILRVISNNQQD